MPPASVLYSNDNLTVIVEPTSGILRAAWAQPLLTASLIDSYYQLLCTAEEYSSRFWLLDLRQRIWPAATFMQWLSDTFAPLATQRLGGPIYIACWITAVHKPHLADSVTTAMLPRVNASGFYPEFFDNEPAARTWLLAQQARRANQPT